MSHADPQADIKETEETMPTEAVEETEEIAQSDEEAPAPTAMATDAGNSARLDELRALIAARKNAIAEKKAAIAAAKDTTEANDQLLWDAKAKHQAATKEGAELDKRKADAQPEAEKLDENADMRETALKLTDDIEANESELEAEERRAAVVETRCKETTSAYAEESKRSADFLTALQKRISDLHEAFARKIAVTSTVDPEGFEAFDHLQDVSVAVMARGKQLSTLTRILREQECLLAINSERLENMKGDYDSQNTALLKQKDEQIRDTIYRFQDERARLHHDIEDMQRINKEQAAALKNGEVGKRTDRAAGNIGQRSTASTREDEEQAQLTADVEALTEKVALAKADIANALEGIRAATKVKSDLIKEDKSLQTRAAWDKSRQDQEMSAIEQSTQIAIQSKARQERENEKLAEAVKLLTRQVKRLKDAAETIENRTKPLPIE